MLLANLSQMPVEVDEVDPAIFAGKSECVEPIQDRGSFVVDCGIDAEQSRVDPEFGVTGGQVHKFIVVVYLPFKQRLAIEPRRLVDLGGNWSSIDQTQTVDFSAEDRGNRMLVEWSCQKVSHAWSLEQAGPRSSFVLSRALLRRIWLHSFTVTGDYGFAGSVEQTFTPFIQGSCKQMQP